eukprot:COSAG02_NODE_21285_length_794_cov_3.060470_2_plen_39_part_01
MDEVCICHANSGRPTHFDRTTRLASKVRRLVDNTEFGTL